VVTTIRGLLLTPDGWLRGSLVYEAGHIVALSGDPVGDEAWRESTEPIVVPGFIDLHVHGGGGADTMQSANGAPAIDTIARTHARRGTPS